MCENPPSTLANNPVVASPSGCSPHAGFAQNQPQGLSSSSPSHLQLSGWPRNISWSEFRLLRRRPRGVPEDAQTATVLMPSRIKVAQENGQFKLVQGSFKVVVDKSNSWVVSKQRSSGLLAHEQGHYDLCGLCYRDLMLELERIRAGSVRELKRRLNEIMKKTDRLADKLSIQYDSEQETNHGLNAERQREWERQIKKSIQSGLKFTPP